jgi:hypothetical protein
MTASLSRRCEAITHLFDTVEAYSDLSAVNPGMFVVLITHLH